MHPRMPFSLIEPNLRPALDLLGALFGGGQALLVKFVQVLTGVQAVQFPIEQGHGQKLLQLSQGHGAVQLARVKAQLRRYTRYNEADKAGDCRDIIDFNGLVINRATHECTLYDRELGLTPIEFDILWMLCENRGQVISAERLFESVWGEKYLDRNNTVMVHIRRLREKMGEPSRNPRFIKTVWGVGYKID